MADQKSEECVLAFKEDKNGAEMEKLITEIAEATEDILEPLSQPENSNERLNLDDCELIESVESMQISVDGVPLTSVNQNNPESIDDNESCESDSEADDDSNIDTSDDDDESESDDSEGENENSEVDYDENVTNTSSNNEFVEIQKVDEIDSSWELVDYDCDIENTEDILQRDSALDNQGCQKIRRVTRKVIGTSNLTEKLKDLHFQITDSQQFNSNMVIIFSIVIFFVNLIAIKH